MLIFHIYKILWVIKMNKWLILTTFLLSTTAAFAQETVVFGSAATPNGSQNTFIVEQPADAPNPLGNPIMNHSEDSEPENEAPAAPSLKIDNWEKHSSESPVITENLPINPQVTPQNTPQAEAKKIQDTIYEDDGRIYDIQSVPVQDINKVEEPNIQPTISTYPAY